MTTQIRITNQGFQPVTARVGKSGPIREIAPGASWTDSVWADWEMRIFPLLDTFTDLRFEVNGPEKNYARIRWGGVLDPNELHVAPHQGGVVRGQDIREVFVTEGSLEMVLTNNTTEQVSVDVPNETGSRKIMKPGEELRFNLEGNRTPIEIAKIMNVGKVHAIPAAPPDHPPPAPFARLDPAGIPSDGYCAVAAGGCAPSVYAKKSVDGPSMSPPPATQSPRPASPMLPSAFQPGETAILRGVVKEVHFTDYGKALYVVSLNPHTDLEVRVPSECLSEI